MATKQVRFYRPYLIDKNDKQRPFQSDFWQKLRDHVGTLAEKDRDFRHNGAQFYGETGLGTSPARDFFRIGRIRRRSDWPDRIGDDYKVSPLTLPSGNLFEAAYLVPFGTANQVAMMGPLRGQVSVQAIESWITQALSLPPSGESVELVPEIDPSLQRKLQQAEGVSSMTVRLPHDATLQTPQGGRSRIERALREAHDSGQHELDVELTFSYGRRAPRGTMREGLLNVVNRLNRSEGYDKVEFSLMVPTGDGDTYRIEHHELVKDTITTKARFEVPEDERLGVDAILQGIVGAIEQFRDL